VNTLRLRALAAGLLALAGTVVSYGPIPLHPATLAAPAVLHTNTEASLPPNPHPILTRA